MLEKIMLLPCLRFSKFACLQLNSPRVCGYKIPLLGAMGKKKSLNLKNLHLGWGDTQIDVVYLVHMRALWKCYNYAEQETQVL